MRPPSPGAPSSDQYMTNPYSHTTDYYCFQAGERIPYQKRFDMPKLTPLEYKVMVKNAKKAPAYFQQKMDEIADHPMTTKGRPKAVSPEKKLRKYVNKQNIRLALDVTGTSEIDDKGATSSQICR